MTDATEASDKNGSLKEATTLPLRNKSTSDKVSIYIDPFDIDSWCETRMNTVRFNYLWTIHDLEMVFAMKRGDSIRSSKFSSPHHDSQWQLRFYPSGSSKETEDYCSIFLEYVSELTSSVTCAFTTSLLEPDIPLSRQNMLIPLHFSSVLHTFHNDSNDWGWRKWHKKTSALIENSKKADKLTIYCAARLYLDNVNIKMPTARMEFKVPDSPVTDNIENFWKTKKFTDLDILVCGQKLQVHKMILGMHSSVFSAMFDREMEEQNHNTLEITDIDYEVFEEMLCYIYTGKAKKLKKFACDLLVAADKYALDGLRFECEKIIFTKIRVENVVDILILADRTNAHQLKQQAIKFINKYAHFIKETKRWHSMIMEQSHLVVEIYNALGKETKQDG